MLNCPSPFWLPGGHVQSIWASVFAKTWPCGMAQARPLQRERLRTPDGDDFIDLDWQHASRPDRPLCVMFHGLEGSSASHYARASAAWAAHADVHWVMPHFRGCSGQINWAPRAYHAGDHCEIDWLLTHLRDRHRAAGGHKLLAVGVSLGGNALLRWAAELGHSAASRADALVALCAPLDLKASAQAISTGFARQVYTRMFLRTMRPKALAKWQQFPGLFSLEAAMKARDLQAFDDAFTAPLHGFTSVHDYWQRASAKPLLPAVQLPTWVVNAGNDPFVPAHSLPRASDVGAHVQLCQPEGGGHVGFATGAWPAQVSSVAFACGQWLLNAAGASAPSRASDPSSASGSSGASAQAAAAETQREHVNG